MQAYRGTKVTPIIAGLKNNDHTDEYEPATKNDIQSFVLVICCTLCFLFGVFVGWVSKGSPSEHRNNEQFYGKFGHFDGDTRIPITK